MTLAVIMQPCTNGFSSIIHRSQETYPGATRCGYVPRLQKVALGHNTFQAIATHYSHRRLPAAEKRVGLSWASVLPPIVGKGGPCES